MSNWRTDRGGLTAPVFPQPYFDGQQFPAVLPLSGGTTLNNYTLACDAASYSLTVGAVTLTADRTLTASEASYTLNIGDAGLQKGLNFDASGASYALTIGDVTLTVARTIGANAPSYALSVGDVTLTAGRTIAADAATYVLSIGDATLTKTSVGSYNLDCDPLALTLTIGDVGLEYTSIATTQPGGGRSRRKTRRYFVEIDGQNFPVSSAEEAQVLLTAAKEALSEQIEQPVAKAKQGRLPVNKPRIRVTGLPGPELTEIVQAIAGIRDEIGQMYRDAARTAEIAYLIGQKRRKDDEEALLLLM